MCYHKANKATAGQLEQYYDAVLRDTNYEPYDFEIGQEFKPGLVITRDRPKELQSFTWGLIPHWCQTLDRAKEIRFQTLNCRSEEMYLEKEDGKPLKPSFYYSATQAKRCIVPCTGFFDSHHITPGKKDTYKIPYFFYSEEGPIMSMAGLYSEWTDKRTGETFNTYTLCTVDANPMMAAIHNNNPRMVAILSTKELEHEWLYGKLTEERIHTICHSMPDDFLKAYPIDKKIFNPRFSSAEKNTPEIIKPVEYDFEGLKAAEAPKEKKTKPKQDTGQTSLF